MVWKAWIETAGDAKPTPSQTSRAALDSRRRCEQLRPRERHVHMKGGQFAFAAAAAALALSPAPAAAQSRDNWDDASTAAEYALVLTALGVPTIKGDGKGALQAGGSMAATMAITQLLKRTIPETRPDRSDRRSFPSGHTSLSFAAAATLQERYGWEVGIPAHAVAAFVGVARVEAKKHDWLDVLAGAAIGEAAGLIITKPRDSSVHFLPWGDTRGGGILLVKSF